MTGRGALGVALLGLIAAGCGGDPDPVDELDAAPEGCPFPPGQSYVATDLQLSGPGEGIDIDGDGEIDNAIGDTPLSLLEAANAELTASVVSGELIAMPHIEHWEQLAADDDSIEFHIFPGRDADEPPDPDDNLGGEGEFYASDLRGFDINCDSTVAAETAAITDDELVATRDEWVYVVPGGTLAFSDATYTQSFSTDRSTGTGQLAGVLSFCSLSSFPFPGDIPGTALDAFINEPALRDNVFPDIDRDGDGLEQVIGNGVTVLHCIDGDGTIYEEVDCPCRPEIVDGYSVAVNSNLVTAHILGVR